MLHKFIKINKHKYIIHMLASGKTTPIWTRLVLCCGLSSNNSVRVCLGATSSCLLEPPPLRTWAGPCLVSAAAAWTTSTGTRQSCWAPRPSRRCCFPAPLRATAAPRSALRRSGSSTSTRRAPTATRCRTRHAIRYAARSGAWG